MTQTKARVSIDLVKDRIASGLQRRAITKCSQWAVKYRVMGKPYPGPWSFEHHPWTRDMHDDPSEMIVGQKAAQMAYTETALNRAFFAIDVLGESVLYILPATTPDATDFSTSRFDPALELSKHLSTLFSDVKNIGHKRAGSANLFVRGSRSRSQLKSLPVSRIILDELDEMVQANVVLAFERTSGQVEKNVFMLSTATIDNYGINQWYRQSSQKHYYFPCPHCSRNIELTYPECLVIVGEDHNDPRVRESYIVCPMCKHKLEHAAKPMFLKNGIWIPTYSDRIIAGYHINQLYSCTVRPFDIAISALKARINPADEQELYNSKLGLTHAVEGARLTDDKIIKATGQHKKITLSEPFRRRGDSIITIGIDVGKFLHVTVMEYRFIVTPTPDINNCATARLLSELKVVHFEELDAIIRHFQPNSLVIDANPERRKATELAQRYPDLVKLCFYSRNANGRLVTIHSQDYTIAVDRTSWLDMTLSRFKSNTITLPIDASIEYKTHMKALVRIYEKDSDGNPVGRYVCGNEEDHFAHAQNYAEIALPIALGIGTTTDIQGQQ